MKIHPITDKFAAGLSIACALHCLLVPSFLIVSSGALALSIDNELIHWTILFLAIPVSIYALVTGVSNHNDYAVFLVGLAGLGTIFATALSESSGEWVLITVSRIHSTCTNGRTFIGIDCELTPSEH